MNQKTIKTEETKKRILSVSKILFKEYGYDATTTRMISTELGMSTGSLFVHYSSKRDILVSILYQGIENAVAKGFENSEFEQDIDSKVVRIFEPVYKFYFKEVEFSRELLKGVLFERHEILMTQVQSFNQRLERLIKNAVMSGEIQNKNDHFIISKMIFSFYFTILLKEVCYEEKPSVKRAISELEKMFDVIF